MRVARDIIKPRIAMAMLVTAAWVAAQEQGVTDAKAEASDAKSDAAGAIEAANSAATVAGSAVDAAAVADQKAVLAEQKANSAAQSAIGAALTNEQQQLLLDGLRSTDQNFVNEFNVVKGDLAKFKETTNDELDNIVANLAEQELFNQSLEDNGYAKKN